MRGELPVMIIDRDARKSREGANPTFQLKAIGRRVY